MIEPVKILDWEADMYTSNLEYSLVIPVYNQEHIIKEVVERIFKNTVGTYEIIFLLDACTDSSENKIIQSISNLPENLLKIRIYSFEEPVFETSCDNFGFKNSLGKYIIEIQADIYIFTYGYNRLLTNPFRTYNDVVTVSGRCTHGLFNWVEGVGKLGTDIEHPLPSSYDNYDIFYVGDTCNRGPWALCKEKLQALDYLDEQNFVLGDDDHDLNIRAKIKYGWVCGYVPIEIKSNLKEGSTRKNRDKKNTDVLKLRQSQSNGGVLGKILRKEINFTTTNIQIRTL